jgi:large subunit ribosomal protein L1
MPNPLHQHGKKYRDAVAKVDRLKSYELAEALNLARETSTTTFDASIEIHIGLGVDPRQADQMVRANVVLPHGTGRSIRVAVIAPEAKHAEATVAGADLVGETELLKEIENGKLNFDLLVATPDMMARLGKVAKILGPRGLMPNPKSGTVTPNVAEAVKQAKAGKVEFRIDKQAIVHQAIGKTSFDAANLLENATTFISAIMTAKPSVAKGTYVKNMSVTTTMGPGIKVDVTQAIAASAAAKK